MATSFQYYSVRTRAVDWFRIILPSHLFFTGFRASSKVFKTPVWLYSEVINSFHVQWYSEGIVNVHVATATQVVLSQIEHSFDQISYSVCPHYKSISTFCLRWQFRNVFPAEAFCASPQTKSSRASCNKHPGPPWKIQGKPGIFESFVLGCHSKTIKPTLFTWNNVVEVSKQRSFESRIQHCFPFDHKIIHLESR